jgi:hypothetical protein
MADVTYGMNPDALDMEAGGNQLPEQDTPETFGDPDPIPGFLLSDHDGRPPEQLSDDEHMKLAKKALKTFWTSLDPVMSKHLAQWKANHCRRKGMTGVAVVKKADKSLWDVYVPPGASADALPHVNYAATLCRKLTSQILADPPAPEVEPPSGDDGDVERAKLSERILVDVQGPHGLNEPGTIRTAYDRSHTYGPVFVRYYVDPKGGGRVPIAIEAGTDPMTGTRASHVSDAAYRMVMKPLPMDDPMGMPEVEQVQEPWPEFEDRFVMQDGALTDDQNQAATRWAPGLKREILTGRNVRLIPHTAEDIWDADGAAIGCFLPWRRVKEMFPAVREFSEEKKKKLFAFKPEQSDDILPDTYGVKPGEVVKDNEGETLVFVLTVILKASGDYPDGVHFMSLADCYVCDRRKWVAEVDGKTKSLAVPLTQYGGWGEGAEGPWKPATMQLIGPGNEIRGAMDGAWFDHLERFNNPHIFLPTNSILQNKYRHLPRGEMVPINPGGKPEFEDVPEFPRDAKELRATVSVDMDNAVSLGQTAQGMESNDVKSGRHAFAVIGQVHAGLSEQSQGVERGYVRACQIQLQLIQAFFDVPTMLRWQGEDGSHQLEYWQGADLGDTTDVRVKPGTLTMLTPDGKMALLRSFYMEDQIIPPAEYKDAVSDALTGVLKFQDDPFRMRVRRQIAAWKKGPEGGEVISEPIMSIDPLTGMPVEQMGPDPRAAQIFTPNLADTLPDVAAMRVQELGKLMSSTAYEKQAPEWRMAVDMEFQRMQMAAMPPAPPEAPGEETGGDPAASGDANEAAKAEAVSLGL